MRPIFFISIYGNDIRPGRAKPDEIRDFIAGGYSGNYSLAHVTVDDNGEIVTTPLTDEEVKGLADAQHADEIRRLRTALDHCLEAARLAADLPGVTVSDPLTIWAAECGYGEQIVREWAAEHSLSIADEPMPAKVKEWSRTTRVTTAPNEWRSIVRIYWPSVKVNDEAATAVEIMCHAVASLGQQAETQTEQEMPF